jgi:hypothetical protein
VIRIPASHPRIVTRPSHQRQQRQRQGGILGKLRAGERIHQRGRVSDQDGHQRVLSQLVEHQAGKRRH